jgi:hypothetical protein
MSMLDIARRLHYRVTHILHVSKTVALNDGPLLRERSPLIGQDRLTWSYSLICELQLLAKLKILIYVAPRGFGQTNPYTRSLLDA